MPPNPRYISWVKSCMSETILTLVPWLYVCHFIVCGLDLGNIYSRVLYFLIHFKFETTTIRLAFPMLASFGLMYPLKSVKCAPTVHTSVDISTTNDDLHIYVAVTCKSHP